MKYAEIATFVSQLVKAYPAEEVAGIVKDYLAQYGSVETYEQRKGMVNLKATFTCGEGPTIVLCGHLDTYSAHPERWKYPPFSGKILHAGKLPIVYGRGSTDMKGGIAGLLLVLHELMNYEGTLTYVLTPDEEIGSRYGASWLLSERLVQGDACIIAEPTALLFYSMGEKGIYRAWLDPECSLKDNLLSRLHSFNVAEHPELQGIVKESNHFFKSLLKEPMDALFTTCMESGGKEDFYVGIPHSCSLTMVEGIVRDVYSEPNLKCILEVYDAREPTYTPKDHWLCRALERGAYETTKKRVKPLITLGSSDASFFREAGIPCVLFGPGEPVLSHHDDEWVNVKKVAQFTKIVSNLVASASHMWKEDSP